MRKVLISRPIGVGVAALTLAGCVGKTVEPEIRTVRLKVPTPSYCLPAAFPDPPEPPDPDNALKAAPSGAERYQMIVAGRLLDRQWIKEIRPYLHGCRKPEG
jgi:hypothetical protein